MSAEKAFADMNLLLFVSYPTCARTAHLAVTPLYSYATTIPTILPFCHWPPNRLALLGIRGPIKSFLKPIGTILPCCTEGALNSAPMMPREGSKWSQKDEEERSP